MISNFCSLVPDAFEAIFSLVDSGDYQIIRRSGRIFIRAYCNPGLQLKISFIWLGF